MVDLCMVVKYISMIVILVSIVCYFAFASFIFLGIYIIGIVFFVATYEEIYRNG